MENARGGDSGLGGEGGGGQGEINAEGLRGSDGESPIGQQQRPEQEGPETFGDSPSVGFKTS